MANGFIKKNWQKDATANLIQSGARIAGGTVTAWGLQKFFGPTKSDGTDNKTMHNIGGPLLVVAGTLGEMMLDDAKLQISKVMTASDGSPVLEAFSDEI